MKRSDHALFFVLVTALSFLNILFFITIRLFIEDHFIENLQAAILLAASTSAIIRFFNENWRSYRWLYLIAGMFFLFLFLEEIVWFQNLLHYPTPGFLKGNLQAESSIHNLWFGLFDRLFTGVAGILSLAVLIFRGFSKVERRWFIPRLSSFKYIMAIILCVYYYISGYLIFVARIFSQFERYTEVPARF